MHDQQMTLDEFESHLDRYGVVLDSWPGDSVPRAKRLYETSTEAQSMLADARAIAMLLDDALPAATLSTGAVRSRILAEIGRDATRSSVFAWLTRSPRVLRPVAFAALMIPLSLGYAIGVGSQPGVSEELVSDVSLLAFADYETYSDEK